MTDGVPPMTQASRREQSAKHRMKSHESASAFAYSLTRVLFQRFT